MYTINIDTNQARVQLICMGVTGSSTAFHAVCGGGCHFLNLVSSKVTVTEKLEKSSAVQDKRLFCSSFSC